MTESEVRNIAKGLGVMSKMSKIRMNKKRARAIKALWNSHGLSFSDSYPSHGLVLETMVREIEDEEAKAEYAKSRRQTAEH